MKDLLAVVTPVFKPKLDWSVEYGLALARLVGAHFTALIAEIEAEHSPCQLTPNDANNIAKLAAPSSTSSNAVEAAELIRAAAADAGISCSILFHDNASCPVRETLIANGQMHDLALLDVCAPLHYPRKGLVEAALFNTGRPIVLVPATVRRSAIRSALIAWDGTPSSVRALHDALPLLSHVQNIVVVTVTGDKGLQRFHSGTDLCRYLARWELVARAETIERGARTVGAALLEYSQEMDADLLIMGGFGHAKEREFIFGSATRDIFQSIPEIPVLLSH